MCSVGICTTEIWLLLLFHLCRQEYSLQSFTMVATLIGACGCIPFSIILLSTFTKQINDAVVRNLRRVSHINLLVNFKNKQYCGCCQLKYFPLLYSKCQSSIIVYLPIGQIISRTDPQNITSRKLSTRLLALDSDYVIL
jgi:Na+/melibiose symporter-like transporter